MKTNTQHVYVRLFDGQTFYGRVFLKVGARLQDLMNDERKFIPIERQIQNPRRGEEDVWQLNVINKEAIILLEERK